MITLSLKLFLAHILGDFVFQPDKWVEDKKKKKIKSGYLYLHLLVHLCALLLMLQFNFYYWKAIALIIAGHFITDLLKLYLDRRINEKLLFALDQLAHACIIMWAVYLYEPYNLTAAWLYEPQTLLFLLFILCVTYVSGVIIKTLLSRWQLEKQSDKDPDIKESLDNAGKYIGMLERLFVFGFIILNQWASIGLLIAAKSIIRFNDLTRANDRKLTEYVLIGTLLSIGLAVISALLYQHLQSIIKL